jgi:hypothetical protein
LDFYLCGPSDGIDSCDASTGTLEAQSDWGDATNNGNAYTLGSGDISVSSAGDYCWFATWAGDTNYPDGASHDGANECFTIAPRTPALTTSATAGPVSPGDPISDTATFTTSPAAPSNGSFGTITFSAYGPDDATCSDTPAFTDTVDVNGTDTSYTSADFTDTHPGTYLWVAQYDPASGDANNVSASTSCADDGETSLVQQLQPNMDTAQNFVPNDSATITVDSGAGDLAGNVVFYMWANDSTCGGGDLTTATYTSDPIDITTRSGTGTSRTVTSDNATAYDQNGDTFSWVVVYTSSNAGHHDVTSACTNETSSITIDNGSTSSS